MTRGAKWFVGVFLAVQALGPLHYYLLRDDRNDERFAWRMFSPTRMLDCDPTFTVGGETRPIDLRREFHEAWLTIAKRGRIQVIERMGSVLCERYPNRPVVLAMSCQTVGGQVERSGGRNVCPVAP
jgi:hypothetical protein